MGLFLGFDMVSFLMLVHLISAALIFPGAVVVNFAGERFFPRRTWAGDLRRPRLAGWVSVPVIWVVVVLSFVFHLEPAFLRRFGWIEASLLHVAGMTIVGSTLSLALGWALPPRSPVRILMKKSRP